MVQHVANHQSCVLWRRQVKGKEGAEATDVADVLGVGLLHFGQLGLDEGADMLGFVDESVGLDGI